MIKNSEVDFDDIPVMSVQYDYPLAPLTSWHIGGNAQIFIQPSTIAELSSYLQQLPSDIPQTWIGLGSNVLISDAGINGVVICSRSLLRLEQLPDQSFYADAGVTCAKFSRFCCKAGFEDGAFFAGIPGTIGGALAMNAGAFGSETWEWVERVVVMNAKGEIVERTPQEYDVSYRTVKRKASNTQSLPHEAFLGAYFRFPSVMSQDGLEKIKNLLRKRSQTQPIGTLNCGSVYRNPPGEFAAKLIESCGLKGLQLGNACISEKHANFIINNGSATAQEVLSLMKIIEKEVALKYNIQLEREVKLI